MSAVSDAGVVYAFGEYELDTRRHELRRAGEPIHIEPQVFDLLAYLLAQRDRLVTKAELLDAVWGHHFVAPATLNSRIKAARHAVGDDGAAQCVIRTVHGRGFRIVVEVEEHPASAASAVTTPPRSPGADALHDVGPPIAQRIRFCTTADGVRLAYATSGAGPPLVKPANWLTHLEYDWESPVWRHWLRELSRRHTLVRYDERGSGLSDWTAQDLSFEAWVTDLETVVDALGLERFALLGISQGCAVALAYAARHPERVSRLVLYGGFLLGARRRARTEQEIEEVEARIRILPSGWGRDNPAFRQFFAAIFLPEGSPEQMRWFCELQRVSTSPANAVRLRSTSADIDVEAVAPNVSAPALVLHATGDAAVPFEEGRYMATLVPDARFVPLDGRNHILLEDEPAWPRFVHEVQRFLSEA